MALTKISRSLLDTGVSDNSDATAITITSAEKVLLGTSTASSSSGARLVLGGDTENYIQFSSTNNVGGLIGVTSAGNIPFYTHTGAVGSESFSERMRITSSGNIGIATASPSEKLEVNGTVKATAFEGDGSSLTNISGGIAASSLATNGYVKFSNGYTIQWGQRATTSGSDTVTFPTAFTNLYSIVTTIYHTTNDTGGVSNADAITPKTSATATGFRISHYGLAGYFWIATGKIT